jgi:hypothetical protein
MTPPAAAAAPAVRPRRAPSPRGPRRVSVPAGSARPAVAPRPTRSRSRNGTREHGLALGFVSSLAQHRLLDRLIRGRTWIGIVAFALIGIVALQLGLLKLNGGIGRALEREGLLQRQNASLSIENSELAAGERVEARAAKLGMTFVSAGALRFLSAGGHDEAHKAASSLSSAARASAARSSEVAASSADEASSGNETESSGEAEATSVTASESESSAAQSPTSESESSEASAPAAGEASAEATSSGSSSGEATASAPASEAPHEASGGETEPSGGSQAAPSGE